MRQGNLKSAYDVIVIPHQAGSAKRLVFDIDSRGTPIAYKKSEQFKYLGMYGESDDITGGMGIEGVAEFDKFVKAGGVLVTLGTASFFPAEFGLAPKVDAARTSAAVLLARRDHRRGDPAAGQPDLLRLRQEDDSGALRRRSAADRADRRQPVRRRSAAAGTAADAARAC